jgi:iron complex outermembrane recepter protein
MRRCKGRRVLLGVFSLILGTTLQLAGARGGGVAAAIRPQPLSDALETFAKYTGYEIVYRTEVARGLSSQGAEAGVSPAETLEQLLRGTGLTFVFVNDRTIAIVKSSDRAPRPRPSGALDSQSDLPPGVVDSDSRSAPKSTTGNTKNRGEHTVIHRGLFAHVAAAIAVLAGSITSAAETSSTSVQGNQSQGPGLQEIIVTAEKISERSQDVPMALSAVSADTLLDDNQLRIQDFAKSVPSFSVTPTPSAGGEQALTIRGISTGFNTTPTVAITVDDVPYGGSGSNYLPDLDPSELDRVEVLRGPQGTLYGASSMGGIVKFVTSDPSTEAVSGHIQAGASDVFNGAQAGYGFRGSLNVPLNDTMAIRVSAFSRRDPGYIDNPVLNINGINEQDVYGGRLAGLWRPSDAFSVKVSALVQNTHGFGYNEVQVQPGLGDLQQDFLKGTGGYDKQTQAYSATLTGKLGDVNVVSLSGYNINRVTDRTDDTQGLGVYSQMFFNVGGAPVVDAFDTYKFSQELRLSSSFGTHVNWLLGGFYTRERSDATQDVLAADLVTGRIVTGPIFDNVFGLGGPATYEEYAGFINADYHVSDQFDVQLGGRESEIRQHSDQGYYNGALVGGYTLVPPFGGSESAFTYLLTPRFRVSSDLMVYARLASGYRPGAPGSTAAGSPCVTFNFPCSYGPDKTENYEVGIKGNVLDHVFTYDAAVYYIDWKDVQVNLTNAASQNQYTANAGSAKSEGIELSMEARPLAGMTVAAWTAWNEAVLTSLPANETLQESVGDRLPYGSRWSANLSFDQQFPIAKDLIATFGATGAYIGERPGTFTAAGPRSNYPGYTQTDIRAGLAYTVWTARLFVNNVADRRAIIGGGNGVNPTNAFAIILPRTIGISLERRF